MANSPTQRTLAWLREQPGFRRAQVVEHWVPQARIRRDLFSFADILAIVDPDPSAPQLRVDFYRDGVLTRTTSTGPLHKFSTWAIQTTSGSNVAARVTKIRQECRDAALDCLAAGWKLYVIGWRKLKPRGQKRATWEPRIVEITAPDLAPAPSAE